MSKISIEGNVSGTGTLTIAAPNTNTNRTLTLPDNTGTIITSGSTTGIDASALSTGTIAAARLPAGSVLQVVTATTTATVTTTSTSFVETGLEVSITPSSASSKILVMASYTLNMIGNAQWVYSTLYRGATNLGTTEGFNGIYMGSNQDIHTPASISYLDSPNTTSATLYEVYIRTDGNTGKFNQPQMRTSIIAMEIAA